MPPLVLFCYKAEASHDHKAPDLVSRKSVHQVDEKAAKFVIHTCVTLLLKQSLNLKYKRLDLLQYLFGTFYLRYFVEDWEVCHVTLMSFPRKLRGRINFQGRFLQWRKSRKVRQMFQMRKMFSQFHFDWLTMSWASLFGFSVAYNVVFQQSPTWFCVYGIPIAYAVALAHVAAWNWCVKQFGVCSALFS